MARCVQGHSTYSSKIAFKKVRACNAKFTEKSNGRGGSKTVPLIFALKLNFPDDFPIVALRKTSLIFKELRICESGTTALVIGPSGPSS